MKRKTFLSRMIQAGGGMVLLPSLSLLNACDYTPIVRTKLTDADIPLLDEIGETIIPSTGGTPGAKATKIGAYMILMVQDCYEPRDQEIFLNGLNTLETRCANQFKNSFVHLKADQKLKILEQLQEEEIAYKLEKDTDVQSIPHYFNLLKNLTISGYFTSEIGMTQARKYLFVPGKFESCIPYKKGDRAWAL
jgi:hypothetical protein